MKGHKFMRNINFCLFESKNVLFQAKSVKPWKNHIRFISLCEFPNSYICTNEIKVWNAKKCDNKNVYIVSHIIKLLWILSLIKCIWNVIWHVPIYYTYSICRNVTVNQDYFIAIKFVFYNCWTSLSFSYLK